MSTLPASATEGAARPRRRRFDLIAFDWDGTLFDSTPIITRCIQRAVQDVGGAMPSDTAAAYVIGMGLIEALAHAAPDVPREKYAELGARYRHHYLLHQNDLALFDGVPELLSLHSSQLKGVFDDSRTADETAGKPDPRMLRELMAALDVVPQRTLMIGDTTHDLQMALNAGCPSVGVSYGAHDHSSFADLQPLFIAHTVAQLQDWLEHNA